MPSTDPPIIGVQTEPVPFALFARPFEVGPVEERNGKATVTIRAASWNVMLDADPTTSREEIVMVSFYTRPVEIGFPSNPFPLTASYQMPFLFGDAAKVGESPGFHSSMALMQVLWRLMQQTITVKERMRPSAPVRGRARRVDFPEQNVVVVTLRRAARKPTDRETEIEWTHQWLVGGHWRNQWYAGLKLHRQIWISPYIKGPEGLPLVLRSVRAYEWVR